MTIVSKNEACKKVSDGMLMILRIDLFIRDSTRKLNYINIISQLGVQGCLELGAGNVVARMVFQGLFS